MPQLFLFNTSAFGFSNMNALSLARLAQVVYKKNAAISKRVVAWGFQTERYKFIDREGTQACIVADEMKILLAFRGTEPTVLRDWATDAKIRKVPGPCGDVHRGFARALGAVLPEIEDTIEDWRGNRQTLWITGHSLGGALAVLAAASFRFREQPIGVNGVYTFGQPRTGSEQFADRYNAALKSKTFRLVNNNDVVTRVPPSKFDYGHVGTLRYFDHNGVLHLDSDLSWWDRFWDRAKGRLEGFLDRNLLDGIHDHNMDNYLLLIERHCKGHPDGT